MTPFPFTATRAKSEARRTRRLQRLADNEALGGKCGDCGAPPGMCSPVHYLTVKPKKVKRKKAPTMKRVKKDCWEALSLYVRARDAAKNEGRCLICAKNPIEVAYHIWPASAGSAAKWNPLGIVGGCGPCNYGEVNNRAEYVFKHIELFGFEAVEKLRLESKAMVQYKRHDFLAMTEDFRARVAALGVVK